MANINQPPVAPDAAFATRFYKSFPYGFYLRLSADEDVQAVIDHPERWVILNINPQSIIWREPNATAITVTQGGGKVIESRGGVLRYGQISGTTGYLPSGGAPTAPTRGGARASLVDDADPDLDLKLGERSGFYKFHRLRHLFRLFAWERRQGNINATMHYMDFKHDEFYRIEPTEFTLRRTAKKPFLYDYDISFTAIEPSDVVDLSDGTEVGSWLLPIHNPRLTVIPRTPFNLQRARAGADVLGAYRDNGTLITVNRMKTLRQAGLGYVQHLSGAVQRRFQDALLKVSKVTQFFDDIHAAATTIGDLPVVLLTQLRGALAAVSDTVTMFAPTTVSTELNAWWLEMTRLSNNLLCSIGDIARAAQGVQRLDDSFRVGAGKRSFASDLLQEVDTSTGSPDANPFIGASGLDLVTDVDALNNTQAVQAVPIFDNDTIWSLAMRVYGDPSRFIDLVVINGLRAPYIVADAANKVSGTLAWGESILAPTRRVASQVDPSLISSTVPTYSSVCTLTSVLKVLLIDATMRDIDWRTDQWIGYTVTLRSGLATEERRVVVANTTTQLTVNYDWTVPPAVNDEYQLTMVLFNAQRPVTEEAKAYGRDLLLKFNRKDGTTTYGRSTATIVFNSRGDLATATGVDNMIQAVRLRSETEQGRHAFHKLFGLLLPIGRSWSEANALFYAYFARKSLIADRRITSVSKARITLQGGTMTFSAEVQLAQARKVHQIQVSSTL